MPNPYGWGQNEPQIKPKDQGGDTISTFAVKIKNAITSLFNTLNSYPWSNATQTAAGYMSAEDKAALDNVPSTYLPLTGGDLTGPISVNGKTLVTVETGTWTPTLYGSSTAGSIAITTNNCFYQKFGNLVYVRVRFEYSITSSPTGEVRIGGAPYIPDFYYTDWMVANANTGLAFSLTNSGIIRPAYLNTSTGQLVVANWGATASSSVWANGVNKTDMVLGQLWYRTSA